MVTIYHNTVNWEKKIKKIEIGKLFFCKRIGWLLVGFEFQEEYAVVSSSSLYALFVVLLFCDSNLVVIE